MIRKDRRGIFGYGMTQLAARREWCFWPKDRCTETAIKAHSIQNSRVLDQLCRDGHVVMPKLKMSATQPPQVVFRSTGRNKATTFTGLCSAHDHELFNAIENDAIQPTNPHHLFLLAYRAVLFEAHASRKAAIDIQLAYQKGTELGLYPKDVESPAGMLAVQNIVAAFLVEETKEYFDNTYLSEDWAAIDHEVLCFNSEPAIAVNGMFTTEIHSEFLDAAAYVTLNVFPTHNATAVVFSFIKEQRTQAAKAFGRIWAAQGYYLQYELSKLILRKCENLVIAPTVFDTFSEKQRAVMAEYFIKNVNLQSFEMDDPHLFLFGRVA